MRSISGTFNIDVRYMKTTGDDMCSGALRIHRLVIVIAMWLSVTDAVEGQAVINSWSEPPWRPSVAGQETPSRGSLAAPDIAASHSFNSSSIDRGSAVAAAALASAVGIAAGWGLGRFVFDSDESAIISAAIIEGVAVPLAIDAAVQREGHNSAALLVSLATAGAGALVAILERSDTAVITTAVAVPLIQIPLLIMMLN